MGLIILAFAFLPTGYFRPVALTLLVLGLLSDVFDGIIARHLGVSTEKLRRLDSGVDQAFWLSIALAAFLHYPAFWVAHRLQVMLLLSAELLIYGISWWRFRKEVATHAISSKVWTLILFSTLIQVLATGKSDALFAWCFYVGLLTRLEIVLILTLLKTWTNDVPSLYHAVLLRQGKPIKRNKLFNG